MVRQYLDANKGLLQTRILNPVKDVRWTVLRKQLTSEVLSSMFDRVLNTPLYLHQRIGEKSYAFAALPIWLIHTSLVLQRSVQIFVT